MSFAHESSTRNQAGKPRWVNASATCGRSSCAQAVKPICRQKSAVTIQKPMTVVSSAACSGPWARGRRGGLDAELLRVLGVQPLPAAELHGVDADDASNGLTGEKPLQHVQADVPPRSAHRNESAVDVVPQRESRAAASQRLQFPADVLSSPAELEHLGCVRAFHLGLGYEWRRRAYRRELCAANGPDVPVRVERSPFAEVLGVRERLPDLCRRVRKVAD